MIRFHNLDQLIYPAGQNHPLAFCRASSQSSKNKNSDFPAPNTVQIDINSFAINTNFPKSPSNFVEFVGLSAIFISKTTPFHPKPVPRSVKTES